jgi:hypothetical protein
VVDNTEKVREARHVRETDEEYGHVIKRNEGEWVRDYGMKRSDMRW